MLRSATMAAIEPVPFRLSVPGSEILDLRGARSVSYKVEGLLNLDHDMVIVEWTGSESTEQFTFSRVGTDVKLLPFETLEVPVEWIAEARLRRNLFSSPRLELRARRLDAFDVVPSARPGLISLKIRRRDRALAAQMVDAIYQARARVEAQLTSAEDDPTALGEGGS